MEKKYHIRSVPRMFEEVTRQIIAYIDAEKIPAGGKLPTERKLSELLEVSRSSVREGLRILELLKYLESRQGDGTFVSEPSPFLLPMQIVMQQIDASTLHKYFEIGLVQAEQVIFNAMTEEVTFENNNTSGSFWKEFNDWIKELGAQVDNDYFLQLWNSIYLLLDEQEFFTELTADIHELKSGYLNKNTEMIKHFFNNVLRR